MSFSYVCYGNLSKEYLGEWEENLEPATTQE
jgi:hypothetical protein